MHIHTYIHYHQKNVDLIHHSLIKPYSQGLRESKLELFRYQSRHHRFDENKVFLRVWGAHFANMWIKRLPKVLEVLEDANKTHGRSCRSGSSGDTTNVQMWLSRLNAMLALFTIIEEDDVDNNDSGEVNWLSNIGTMEVKWLEVRGKISELREYCALLSSARVRSGRFLILCVSFFHEFSLFVGFSRASSSYAIHCRCYYSNGKIDRYTSLHLNSLQR
jgi:hypothetical protein